MIELINKLEQMGKSGSLKQSQLKQLLEQNGIAENQLNTFIAQPPEYSCLLLPDDDED